MLVLLPRTVRRSRIAFAHIMPVACFGFRSAARLLFSAIAYSFCGATIKKRRILWESIWYARDALARRLRFAQLTSNCAGHREVSIYPNEAVENWSLRTLFLLITLCHLFLFRSSSVCLFSFTFTIHSAINDRQLRYVIPD